MNTLRSFVRWPFAVGALLFLAVGIEPFFPLYDHGSYALTPLRQGSISFVFVAIAFVFATAFWTTRKPSGARNGWGIAAGIVYVLLGALVLYFQLRYSTFPFSHARTYLVPLAIGIASIVAFGRRTSPPVPVPVRASVPGDRTHPWAGKAIIWTGYAAVYATSAFWIKFAHTHHIIYPIGIVYLVLIVLANLTSTVLHEAGHAVAAWIFEMKLLGFNAGPFDWTRRAGVWKFKFRLANIISPAGAVRVAPTNRDRPRWHDVCMLAAAPFVNLVTGLAALYVALHGESFSGETWQFIAFFASWSLIAAVQNMLPFLAGTTYTDGARIVQLLTDSPMVDLYRVGMDSQATLVTPLRPRDMDLECLRRACQMHSTDLSAVHLRLTLAQALEDIGDHDRALAVLSEAEAIYVAHSIDLPAPLHTCFIISHALLHRDAVAARLWWNRMQEKKPKDFNVDYWLARAGLLLTEDRLEEANVACQQAEAQAKKTPQAGAYDFDRDRCTRLRRDLELAAFAQQRTPSSFSETPSAAVPPGHAPEPLFANPQALAEA